MKKAVSMLLAFALVFSLASCGSAGEGINTSAGSDAPASVPLATVSGIDTGYPDVPAGADYAAAVIWCREQGLMSGDEKGLFHPDGVLDRRTLATVLHRAEGEPVVNFLMTFPDVEEGVWYTEAVRWAASERLMNGYDDGRFGSTDAVSREMMQVILDRYMGRGDTWVGKPELAGPATRAEIAVALMENLRDRPASPRRGTSAVYMTADISADGLMDLYAALDAHPAGKVAVKLSTGENGSNYLRPELIGDLVQSLDATIVECNTAYGGNRASTAMHKQLAADHGYTAIAPVDIMDEDGELALPVTGGDNLTENYVGSHFANYDYYVVLSHFKGHAMAGYGGAIKNISIGIASSKGKSHIHTGGKGGSMWSADQDAFLESMAEAGKSVVDYLGGSILYINVMNRLSVDCDCDSSPAEPDMHDIGILGSYDPVALDQACVDLVYAARDGGSLVKRIESRNGLHTLEQAEKIGLGSRDYKLVSIDEGKEEKPVSSKINVSFNGHTYTATLEDNPTAEAFVKLIREKGGALTVSASDYGGWEKVAPLGTSLPANNRQTTTSAGDFVLYSGNQIVLFYGSNSWSYTCLGKLDGDLSNLKTDLGSGDVDITYALP